MLTITAGVAIYVASSIVVVGLFYGLYHWSCRSKFIAACIDYSGLVMILVPMLVFGWWIWWMLLEQNSWQRRSNLSVDGVVPAATAATTAPGLSPSSITRTGN